MNVGAYSHLEGSLLLLQSRPLLLLPLLLLVEGKRSGKDLLFVGNWIGYYLPGEESPDRVGILLPDLAVVVVAAVVVVLDGNVKAEKDEFAYVPWEQQPDDFLISICSDRRLHRG